MTATIDKTATPDAAEGAPSEHYARLLQGMAHAVAAKGYADTTIADIVREAAVSRRTFYEHFSTKTECLIALYETASRLGLQAVSEAFDPAQPWHTQVEQAMTAYMDYLAQDPVLLRTLFVEILGLGLPGLAARRRVNGEIANFIQVAINSSDSGEVPAAHMSSQMAMTVVGGINELVLQAIEQDRVGDLRELVAPATRLVRAVAADSRR
ncbi:MULTISPECIES: TetR/AcrR family transcriptional regulator [Variovorax]|uniref:AcrR family transcriptional regulator n=1 Tax=Variovorax boronicumulans TaxID=436515 RepID=A0AAW8DQ88_9BURK|nr:MULTISPECIES: TetR/AcrR family transcriptional regulator [Variovorax]MDP9876246.1 AcrR family transcriptional regulator [Variovorax boronicumulans]MDP9908169.1 AcrR family transcriptional regulator [Variovorax boronicumulans]MDP9919440.1 AcrR family transcriptional regulator [Variovorax boronicumulans]MDP9921530.1 AcrR family transcriptional regulator [Variovorax boronicumulans]OEZ32551.1 TetR family transcriptional regulator [Variovorax boronicumulans]